MQGTILKKKKLKPTFKSPLLPSPAHKNCFETLKIGIIQSKPGNEAQEILRRQSLHLRLIRVTCWYCLMMVWFKWIYFFPLLPNITHIATKF